MGKASGKSPCGIDGQAQGRGVWFPRADHQAGDKVSISKVCISKVCSE